MGPRPPCQPETEKDDAAATADASARRDPQSRHAARRRIVSDSSGRPRSERPQSPEQPRSPRRFRRGARDRSPGSSRSSSHVDDDQRAVAASSGREQAGTVGRVAFQVPGVRLDRVAAPEDHEIAAVLDFAQRAGRFAHLLHGHHRGAVAARRRSCRSSRRSARPDSRPPAVLPCCSAKGRKSAETARPASNSAARATAASNGTGCPSTRALGGCGGVLAQEPGLRQRAGLLGADNSPVRAPSVAGRRRRNCRACRRSPR